MTQSPTETVKQLSTTLNIMSQANQGNDSGATLCYCMSSATYTICANSMA